MEQCPIVCQFAPYGTAFDVSGSFDTPFGFTSEQTDGDLIYLRARYYNPAAGVFTARDPFEGVWAEPMSINGYGYVHGNPVMWTDPSGECPVCVVAIALGIFGIAWAWATAPLAAEAVTQLCAAGIEEVVNLFRGSPDTKTSDKQQLDWLGLSRAGSSQQVLPNADDVPTTQPTTQPTPQDREPSVPEGTPQRRPCDQSPFNYAVKCTDLPGYSLPVTQYQGGAYNCTSFADAMARIATRHGTNVATLVAYSRTDGRISTEDAAAGNVRGDSATRGPCNIYDYPLLTGSHWDVWANQSDFERRQRPRNIQPIKAIGRCKCCDDSNGSAILYDRFAVIERRER